jgi:hypothetical protein
VPGPEFKPKGCQREKTRKFQVPCTLAFCSIRTRTHAHSHMCTSTHACTFTHAHTCTHAKSHTHTRDNTPLGAWLPLQLHSPTFSAPGRAGWLGEWAGGRCPYLTPMVTMLSSGLPCIQPTSMRRPGERENIRLHRLMVLKSASCLSFLGHTQGNKQ